MNIETVGIAVYEQACLERDEARAEVERLNGNLETMQVNADWCAVELPRLQASNERLRARLADLLRTFQAADRGRPRERTRPKGTG